MPGLILGEWTKAAACTSSSCAFARLSARGIELQDSRRTETLVMSPEEWTQWTTEVIRPEGLSPNPVAAVVATADNDRLVSKDSAVLRFSEAEWSAFTIGIEAGDFRIA